MRFSSGYWFSSLCDGRTDGRSLRFAYPICTPKQYFTPPYPFLTFNRSQHAIFLPSIRDYSGAKTLYLPSGTWNFVKTWAFKSTFLLLCEHGSSEMYKSGLFYCCRPFMMMSLCSVKHYIMKICRGGDIGPHA
jgi:hypothetical protein